MRDSASFWKKQERALENAARGLRRATEGSAVELEEILARTALAAKVARERAVVRRAHPLRRRLARARALEVDRDLLRRLERLGLLSADAATALGARWEERAQARREAAARIAGGRAMRRLRKALSKATRKDGRLRRRLEDARERLAPRPAPRTTPGGDDLRRHRRMLRRWNRVHALCANWEGDATRSLPSARAVEALDRWHALRRLRRRLARERRAAGWRGGVALILELDRAISAIDASRDAARREAVAGIARATSNVVRFQRRSA